MALDRLRGALSQIRKEMRPDDPHRGVIEGVHQIVESVGANESSVDSGGRDRDTFSVRETARKLGITEKTVLNRMKRADITGVRGAFDRRTTRLTREQLNTLRKPSNKGPRRSVRRS